MRAGTRGKQDSNTTIRQTTTTHHAHHGSQCLWEEFENGDCQADNGDHHAGKSDGEAKFKGLHLGSQVRDVLFRGEVFEAFGSDDIAVDRVAERVYHRFGLRFVETRILQFLDDFVGVKGKTDNVPTRLSQAFCELGCEGWVRIGRMGLHTSFRRRPESREVGAADNLPSPARRERGRG